MGVDTRAPFFFVHNAKTTVFNSWRFDMAKRRIWDEFGEAYRPSDRLNKNRKKRVENVASGVVSADGTYDQLAIRFEEINHPISEYQS